MKSCPVATCEEPTPSDKHMCRYHWFKVPLHLRTAVWSAYNSYLAAIKKRDRTVESVKKAGDKLREAQAAATKSVDEQLLGKVAS